MTKTQFWHMYLCEFNEGFKFIKAAGDIASLDRESGIAERNAKK